MNPLDRTLAEFQRLMRREIRESSGHDLLRLAADQPDGVSIDPLVPHREHDRPREDWPTATLMELRPTAHPALILDAAAARCWQLSEPYLGATTLVVGSTGKCYDNQPDQRLHAWAASDHGHVAGAEVGSHRTGSGRNMFLADLRGTWPPGTTDDELFDTIGYTTFR